jgi:hypothetical protein
MGTAKNAQGVVALYETIRLKMNEKHLYDQVEKRVYLNY